MPWSTGGTKLKWWRSEWQRVLWLYFVAPNAYKLLPKLATLCFILLGVWSLSSRARRRSGLWTQIHGSQPQTELSSCGSAGAARWPGFKTLHELVNSSSRKTLNFSCLMLATVVQLLCSQGCRGIDGSQWSVFRCLAYHQVGALCVCVCASPHLTVKSKKKEDLQHFHMCKSSRIAVLLCVYPCVLVICFRRKFAES